MTFLPIVERELRVAARRKGTYWLRSLAALAVMLIFLCAALGNNYGSSAERARQMFYITSALALGGCLLSGVFQTADCLSSEKREGTLGLLFLTDLRGYDVVLGKLVSGSLHTCYGLLSILPVLGLPLLMGGVTGGEFWRLVLVLLVALFFSLGVGMLASAVSRESRQTLALTAFAVLLLTGVLPAVYAALKLFLPYSDLPARALLWPGLGYTFREALADYYSYRTGPHEFWGSLLTVWAIGLFCLALAVVILPHVWQERAQKGPAGRGLWTWLRFQSAGKRRKLRAALLRHNPFYWLTVRDQLPRIGAVVLLGVALPVWLAFFWSAYSQRSSGLGEPYEFMMFATFGISLVFKVVVAGEASRRLCDDRQSGALELMLVTPLTERQIIAGQRRALWRQFWSVFLVLVVLFLGNLWLIYRPNSTRFLDPVLGIMMAGNVVVLVTDFYALGWVGMWAGLRARQHPRAVLGTIARILFIPWLIYFLMGFSGFFNGTGRNGLVVWFVFGVVNDLFWAGRARNGLRHHFRSTAAGIAGKQFRRPAPPVLQPATT